MNQSPAHRRPPVTFSSPERRQLAAGVLSLAKPAIDLTAIAARRTLVRSTKFVVVVGSLGKTTTTRALSLGLTGSISRFSQNNAGAWNALAVLSTPPGKPISVVEVGISGPGQMAPRARVLRPDVVVVTSIASEHHRSFGTLENTRAEKALMVEALPDSGTAVLNGDDDNVLWMGTRTSARTITFGTGRRCDVRASEVRVDWPHGTRFELACDIGEFAVRTPLLGRRTLNAILATAAVALSQDLPLEPVLERLEALEPMRSRLQMVRLESGAFLIRDEQKSTIETIDAAFDLLEEIPARRKVCVLGAVSEPKGSQREVYRRLGDRLGRTATHAVLIADSETRRRYRVGIKAAGASTELLYQGVDMLAAIEALQEFLEPEDVVLVKGRDTQCLSRISLGLAGRPVRCNVQRCQIKLTDCDFCGRLETGWPDNPKHVP